MKELLDSIVQRAVEGMTATKLAIKDARKSHYLLGKEHFTVDEPVNPRAHTVETLPDFFAAVTKYGDKGTIWHNTQQVILVIDDDDRRETVRMPLVLGEHWKTIQSLGSPLSQADFIKLLRFTLEGVVPPTLRAAISKIEFATTAGQRNEINPGRERGSREFAVDLANSGEIPETYFATLTVFANAGLRTNRNVKMSLDYTMPPAPVCFVTKALPDELLVAMQTAQAELQTLLEGNVEIPVFCGTP